MRKNHYRALGVAVSATSEEVKVAFRRRAKELHPDRSGLESGPFLEVQEAYAILSDFDQRRKYDDETFGRPAHCNVSAPSAEKTGEAEPLHATGRVGPTAEGLIEEFLTRFRDGPNNPHPSEPSYPQDLTAELAISPQKAWFGGMMRIRFPIQTKCSGCRGRGSAGSHVCWRCGGKGALFGEIPLAVDLPTGVRDCAQVRVPLEPYGIPNSFANIVLRVRGGNWDWI